jgi:two-component system, cell cycle response regulator
MAAALKDAREPSAVAAILVTGICAAFGGVRVAAVVTDRPPRWVLATSESDAVQVSESMPRPFAARSGVTLQASLDADEDPALAAGLPDARNVVLLPMVVDGSTLGVVGVECGGPRRMRVASDAVSMLEHYASHGALALRNAHLLADVTQMALSDPLTSLANRRSFEEAFARETARARRSNEPVSVVMVDIDHFKRVNDDHGHDMGDEVLRHVGGRLPKAARPMDVCARLGGEEFVVLLPGCTPVEAIQVAERLRAAIASDAPLPVTASAGVATLGVHVAEPDDLLTAADEALYAAKHAGRDRVALSTRVPDSALTASAAP